MIKTIENLVAGKYEFVPSAVSIDTGRVDAVTCAGENYQGKLHIESKDAQRLRGFCVSDNARIVPERDRFSGTDIVLIYGIDVTGLAEGDRVNGTLTLVTNAGEFPVVISLRIKKEVVRTSLGAIASLDDFASLAQVDYDEAFRLFRRPQFAELLDGEDRKYRTLCQGLKAGTVTRQRMEEFLICAGKKQPVEITADRRSAAYFGIRETIRETLTLRRSTWGALAVAVSVEGDFLEVPKRVLTEEDFVGSICELDYLVRAEKIGHGRHTGRIRLKSVYAEVVLEVAASADAEARLSLTLEKQKHEAHLAERWLDLRLGKTDPQTFAGDTEKDFSYLRENAETACFYTLLEASAARICGDAEQAGALLSTAERAGAENAGPEERALRFSLREQLGFRDKGRDASERIEELFNENGDSLVLLILHLQTDVHLRRMPYQQLILMQEVYETGCRSPFLYAEALNLLRKDDSLLMRMTPFFRAVLVFAVHHDAMTEALAVRAAYLSDNEKNWSVPMYRILKDSYDTFQNDSVLEAVCRLLMKGSPRSERFFPWYARAVERSLRITRLYEYYMETMPEGRVGELLPAPIRKYFAWNDTLPDDRKALLYANIIRHKDRDPGTFAAYHDKMEDFALKSLGAHRISGNLAVIYQEMIRQVRDTAMAEALADAMFTEKIYTDAPDIRCVIVCHEELSGEERFPVRRGCAFIRRYTDDAQILFEDGGGRRFLSPVAYSSERLMNPEKYRSICQSFDVRTTGFLLYVCRKEETVSIRNLDAYRCASESEAFSEEFRQKTGRKLLAYYAENAGGDTLDEYLSRTDLAVFAPADRARLIELLIERGKYESAFALLGKYGYEHVKLPSLIRLASRLIEQNRNTEKEDILLLSAYVFRLGKYDELILGYLVDFFNGSLPDLLAVREKAVAFGIGTYPLDERILTQAMFTHRFIPEGPAVFRAYYREAGKQKVVRAYLTCAALYYFMSEEKVDPYLAGIIAHLYEKGETTDIVLRLALLMYYSQKPLLTSEEEFRVDALLEEFAGKGLRFRFFQNLPKNFLRQYQLEDKVFVEQRACVTDTVTLHYQLSSDPEKVWRREPLPRRYREVFSREFVLFYGETLTYYISVLHNGEEHVTEKTTAHTPFVDMQGRSSYQLINQMLYARRKGDMKTLREKLREYLRAVQKTDALFKLEEET